MNRESPDAAADVAAARPEPFEPITRQADIAGSTPSRERNVGIDLTRAIALVGVVTMNFHGYLNFINATTGTSLISRVFNPWQGVLSTRFAATFVTVAGIGVALLSARSRASGDRQRLTEDRWRLTRRGVLLLAGGFVLNWIWPGTILFFYGAYFIVAAAILNLRSRWLALIGLVSALAAQAIQLWALERIIDRRSVRWLFGTDAAANRSPRELVFDIWVNGTHPLLPWLAFFCLGMILGRHITSWSAWRWRLVGVGIAMVAGGYVTSTLLSRAAGDDPTSPTEQRLATLALTDPFNRSLLYVIVTIGSSIVAVMTITWLGERFAGSPVVQLLARAGQMTLTIYVLHVFVFNLVVNVLGWIKPAGLDVALGFAVGFWAVAVVIGSWWNRFLGQGPLERIYRRFGGEGARTALAARTD